MHSKHTFFDAHAWLHSCKHPYKLSPSPINDAQKNGQKRTLIDWDMFFFMHKTTKEKLRNSTIKLTIEPQKGPKTAEQSTQNVALYEINARWERKKAKNNSILASSDGMYIPVHHGEFFCQLMALLRTVFRLRLVLLVVRLLSRSYQVSYGRTYLCSYWTLQVLWSTL